jgi:hypothetical protein
MKQDIVARRKQENKSISNSETVETSNTKERRQKDGNKYSLMAIDEDND